MTLRQMIDMAELYLYEVGPKGREAIPAPMVLLLNQSQDRLISMLKHGVITDLDESDTSQSLGSDGEYALSSLSETVWQGMRGIDGIMHTDGNFCRRISFNEFVVQNDLGRSWTGDHPAYYVRGGTVYILPYSGYTIDVYYRKEPVQMAVAAKVADDTVCELNAMFHPLIVGLALEDYVDLNKAIARVCDKTLRDIETLNDNYKVTDSLDFAVFHNPHDSDTGLDFLAI